MANSPKYRDFFITINQDADCYQDVEEIVKNQCNYKLFGLITHDKDEIIDKETGEHKGHKPTHKHLMIELANPISFQSMQKRFPGSHIDIPKYKKSAYQYLIHNSPRSKGEKYEYSLTEVITNNPGELKIVIESETFELFYENQFINYIADGTRTPYQFAKRFGLNAYRQYWKPYSDMLAQLETDPVMKHDLEKIVYGTSDDDLPF